MVFWNSPPGPRFDHLEPGSHGIHCWSLSLKESNYKSRLKSILSLWSAQAGWLQSRAIIVSPWEKSMNRSQRSFDDQYCQTKSSCHIETPPCAGGNMSSPDCVRIIALSLCSLGMPTSKAQNQEGRKHPAMDNPDFPWGCALVNCAWQRKQLYREVITTVYFPSLPLNAHCTCPLLLPCPLECFI